MKMSAIVAILLQVPNAAQSDGVYIADGGYAGSPLPFRTDVRFSGELIAIGNTGSAARCNAFGLFTLTGSFTGQATHLGHVTGTFSNCTMFPIPGPVDIMAGEVTIIAASGERLVMTYFGAQEAVDLQTFTAGYAVSYEIIGGTGRFDDASGMLEASGVVDFNPGGLSSEVAEGWIRFDASNSRR